MFSISMFKFCNCPKDNMCETSESLTLQGTNEDDQLGPRPYLVRAICRNSIFGALSTGYDKNHIWRCLRQTMDETLKATNNQSGLGSPI